MDKLSQLEKRISEIENRNTRVEKDKAWETSWFRIFNITIITYIITSLVFSIIEVKDPLLNALIPTTAFFLSVQSIPGIKRWWLKRYNK
jgi:hypothetical protein|tara:strand:- start:1020 stop:1286 length:267 start_codon:yes stop_codon:yes gene_type:complete